MSDVVVPSGLGATIGFGTETTPGTYAAPTRWLPFTKEALEKKKTVVTSNALGLGRVKTSGRRAVTGVDVTGSVDVEVTENGMGALFQAMLGGTSTSTEIGTSGVYKQVHQFGDPDGSALTVQVGRPTVGGSIIPFTYLGCKVVDWTLSVQAGGFAELALTLDGINETTGEAYVAPSVVVSAPLHFAEGELVIGGTVTTTDGVASVTGGLTLSGGSYAGAIKSVELKGSTGLAVDRRTLGSLTKLEQLVDAYATITGSFEIEFVDEATIYDVYDNETPIAIHFALVGSSLGEGINAGVDVIIPVAFIEDGATPTVQGPNILTQKPSLVAYSDSTNTPIQITYTTTDTAI